MKNLNFNIDKHDLIIFSAGFLFSYEYFSLFFCLPCRTFEIIIYGNFERIVLKLKKLMVCKSPLFVHFSPFNFFRFHFQKFTISFQILTFCFYFSTIKLFSFYIKHFKKAKP